MADAVRNPSLPLEDRIVLLLRDNGHAIKPQYIAMITTRKEREVRASLAALETAGRVVRLEHDAWALGRAASADEKKKNEVVSFQAILGVLRQCPNPVPATMIAGHLCTTTAVVNPLLYRLEKQGFVIRDGLEKAPLWSVVADRKGEPAEEEEEKVERKPFEFPAPRVVSEAEILTALKKLGKPVSLKVLCGELMTANGELVERHLWALEKQDRVRRREINSRTHWELVVRSKGSDDDEEEEEEAELVHIAAAAAPPPDTVLFQAHATK
jgi:hypothetical protein